MILLKDWNRTKDAGLCQTHFWHTPCGVVASSKGWMSGCRESLVPGGNYPVPQKNTGLNRETTLKDMFLHILYLCTYGQIDIHASKHAFAKPFSNLIQMHIPGVQQMPETQPLRLVYNTCHTI